MKNPRQLAFIALREVHRRGAFADVALDRTLRNSELSELDRRLLTEIVYGSVRRMRSLDFLIDQLAKKPASQQPPDLRTILHIGLYQLQYLTHIPPSAAVNTTVQLTKENGFSGLSSFVNGLLRQYTRITPPTPPYQGGAKSIAYQEDANSNTNSPPHQAEAQSISKTPPYQGGAGGVNLPLKLPENPIERLGIIHSFPDWLIQFWLEQIGETETEKLCQWFNQSPTIDLRINPLRTTIDEVENALKSHNIAVNRIPYLPQALRLNGSIGAIYNLPGYNEGWWTIQDSSAQLVTHLLDPQPGETIIDACAAPGGKTTHIAELMQDKGTIIACDKTESRLKKLKQNAERMQLKSIEIHIGDSRNFPNFTNIADRVLLDAPCSGLGTLHRRADARWNHTEKNIEELSILQSQLLANVATFVKPGGKLVYATCTIHPLENENIIESFLTNNHEWQIEPPTLDLPIPKTPEGYLKVWPQTQQMDGFFIASLNKF
ncbi:16S rRNA (cytosine(967)-C(5))-methyltransferase [Kamptonema sp. UHCC 0994]|uniref:16S rRNA (cytosine(967)-C(5))-methyltransferase n=1 Tax=Kamptonema sp. UHCC 0994 TaxID=3031329 RepID=UPI0023B949CF|nr:16S rRNA (cytosine(967)-C(5))-methyltransferase [Kamptonema sp. UHCC 0994]MDF0554351.1 16S rRNA (cytosine(967)-C(5))-methyltransferase [Kamptonema sp. UHCC 0994]